MIEKHLLTLTFDPYVIGVSGNYGQLWDSENPVFLDLRLKNYAVLSKDEDHDTVVPSRYSEKESFHLKPQHILHVGATAVNATLKWYNTSLDEIEKIIKEYLEREAEKAKVVA